MITLEQQHSINCDADESWQVLADFGNFLAWATAGTGTAKLEGEGIGMIRHLDIPGLGQVSERLDKLDHAARTLGYTMVSEPMAGMAVYSAEVRVVHEANGTSSLVWCGRFEPLPGFESEDVKHSLSQSYALMSQALDAFITNRQTMTLNTVGP